MMVHTSVAAVTICARIASRKLVVTGPALLTGALLLAGAVLLAGTVLLTDAGEPATTVVVSSHAATTLMTTNVTSSVGRRMNPLHRCRPGRSGAAITRRSRN
jgi:hypothetical protein